MEGVAGLHKLEIFAWDPALHHEAAFEELGIADVAEAFGGANVEPDAERRLGLGGGDKGEDAALIPPEGGRHNGEAGEDVRVSEAKVEGDEAAEGGAAETSLGGFGAGAEGGVDPGLELFDEETAVAMAFASAHAIVAGGGVLGHAAKAGVGDADEDEGFGLVGGVEAVGGFSGSPGVAGYIGGGGVEEVLAVVEIEDGKTAGGFGVVLRRQVHRNRAVVREDGGVEVEVAETRDVRWGQGCKSGGIRLSEWNCWGVRRGGF